MTTIYDKLLAYGNSDAYPFHMPGHKRQITDFVNPFQIDITEIDGFDNLHHPEGILKEAQERAAALYGSRREPKWGINGGILPEDVEKLLAEYPKTQAVLLTSPTYDGAVSDIRGIARICHAHRVPLIVDEAHGAHLGFHPYFPESALKLGADVVIQSFHKTLPSLTQTAVLHVGRDAQVDEERIRRFLGIYQSSSPSYIFMAAMDRCVEFLKNEGKERFEAFAARLEDFYAFAGGLEQIRIPGYEIRGSYGIFDFDPPKSCWCPLLMAENGSAGSSGKKTIWSLRWKQGAMGWL